MSANWFPLQDPTIDRWVRRGSIRAGIGVLVAGLLVAVFSLLFLLAVDTPFGPEFWLPLPARKSLVLARSGTYRLFVAHESESVGGESSLLCPPDLLDVTVSQLPGGLLLPLVHDDKHTTTYGLPMPRRSSFARFTVAQPCSVLVAANCETGALRSERCLAIHYEYEDDLYVIVASLISLIGFILGTVKTGSWVDRLEKSTPFPVD